VIIISRIVTALLLALVGLQIGESAPVRELLPGTYGLILRDGVLILAGAGLGWLFGGVVGSLLKRGLARLRATLQEHSGAELAMGAIGLIVGLVVSLLISQPLLRLEFVGTYLLLPMTLIVSYVFAEIAAVKHAELLRLVGIRVEREGAQGKLIDSSALIDGRIADVAETGFLEGELIVPVFVLEEIQLVADSSDDQRRARGRRGLDVVQRLRKRRMVSTPDVDYPDVSAVDSKLVRLAAERNLAIVTTDFNLNKVAKVQGVTVLNVNELANAIKPEFVAGEQFELKVVKEGKERGQGVGYLDDGTMVVVDQGREHIGSVMNVEVTSVLQSPAGRLVFTRPVVSSGDTR
jgi:uncharacterized protein YacL